MVRENSRILVVDDELSMRELLELMLTREGYQVTCAGSGLAAISDIKKKDYDLVLSDIRLGDVSGIDVLKTAKQKNQNTAVIMISAYASTENAVEAMNLGAFDYVPKPFDNLELKSTIAKALQIRITEKEKELDEEESEGPLHFNKIVGNCPRMLHIYKMVRQVARTRTNVLITGESGTGKELIARAIHDESDRKGQPFVVINCGGIPENLIESELFGYCKGAFTGANQDKKGLMEIAHGGTFFLDEIGELTLPLQVKLLRAIQERVFKPVGGLRDVEVDVRFVSATNKRLAEEVMAGNFREDLFYRLNVIEINVPPLRERKGDLRMLVHHFLEKYAKEMGKEVTKVSSYAVDLLQKYDFPGNIRELENLIERSVALTSTNIILPDSLALSVQKRRWIEGVEGKRFNIDDVTNGVSLDTILEDIERAYINKALACAGNRKKQAADLLGMTFRSFRYRLEKLGIDK
jgi:two-component system, NtrC family, response regulator PilR